MCDCSIERLYGGPVVICNEWTSAIAEICNLTEEGKDWCFICEHLKECHSISEKKESKMDKELVLDIFGLAIRELLFEKEGDNPEIGIKLSGGKGYIVSLDRSTRTINIEECTCSECEALNK